MNESIEHLERRVAFLENTLAKFLAYILHYADDPRLRSEVAKTRAASKGGREVIQKALDAALLDLIERAELTETERMAMPDPHFARRMQDDAGADRGRLDKPRGRS